ncbi:hypothetical protein FVB9532_00429 [Mesonia oceanica]|uniref:Uncharacterized protein n=1 Tax=Mesonia oceanica TaxID=2687242 RepID=A0AC61Y448_9FLAO|nr:hypothetical protein FVB9532_00429 [Mesonia oceanica]
MGIDTLLSYISTGALLINVILYLIGFRNSSNTYKVVFLYLILSFLIQGIALVFSQLSLNNHFLSTYYLLIRFSLLSLFFFCLFREIGLNRLKNTVLVISSIALLTVLSQYLMKPTLYYQFNPIGFLITSLVLIVFAVIYLYELLSRKNYYLFFVLGLLIYLISSSIIFISATDIININNELNYYIWIINASLYLGYQVLISWQWKELHFSKEKPQ